MIIRLKTTAEYELFCGFAGEVLGIFGVYKPHKDKRNIYNASITLIKKRISATVKQYDEYDIYIEYKRSTII